jgi:transcriptional regulator with XRE-family HTH domain
MKQKQSLKQVQDWILGIMDSRGWTGTELARKSDLSPSTVLRILKDDYGFFPTLSTLRKISRGGRAPLPEEFLLEAGTQAREYASRPQQGGTTKGASGAREKRLLRVRQVTASKARFREEAAVVTTACPRELELDGTAFALHMPDDGMEPFVKPGALMYASKARDPIKHDYVWILLKDGKSMVRLLRETTEDAFLVSSTKYRDGQAPANVPFVDVREWAVIRSYATA